MDKGPDAGRRTLAPEGAKDQDGGAAPAGLVDALRRRVDGEVLFRRRQPRRVHDRRVELPPGAHRRGRAAHRGRGRHGRRGLRRTRCAGALPRRRYEPGRAVHQRRRGDRLDQVLPRLGLGRPASTYLRRRTRHRPGRVQPSTGRVRLAVRPEALDAQPLRAGRHDRQQLLRRVGAGVRQDGRQRAAAGGPHLRRRPLLGRPHLGRGVRADRRRRRAPRRDLPGTARPGRPQPRRDPPRLPAHPAPRLRIQPRLAPAGERLRRRPRPRRQRRHPRDRAARRTGTGAGSRVRGAARSATRTSPPPPTTYRRP
ncbi:hypothetical protein SRIMM317S_00219 [Streptomyces rimosus subsp. rimosus]